MWIFWILWLVVAAAGVASGASHRDLACLQNCEARVSSNVNGTGICTWDDRTICLDYCLAVKHYQSALQQLEALRLFSSDDHDRNRLIQIAQAAFAPPPGPVVLETPKDKDCVLSTLPGVLAALVACAPLFVVTAIDNWNH